MFKQANFRAVAILAGLFTITTWNLGFSTAVKGGMFAQCREFCYLVSLSKFSLNMARCAKPEPRLSFWFHPLLKCTHLSTNLESLACAKGVVLLLRAYVCVVTAQKCN